MNIQGSGRQYSVLQTALTSTSQKMNVSEIFSNDDANADGVLTIDETPLSEDMFSQADADEDGSLTQEEMEEMLAAGARPDMAGMMSAGGPGGGSGGPGGPGSGAGVESLTTDEDSEDEDTITTQETSLAEELFALLDENDDDSITLNELETALTEQENQIDQQTETANYNQTLGIAAYREAINSFMSQMSTDQNGSNIDTLLETIV